ncbi:MAG TPA: TonB-dependent receptor [Ignavibacteriaceae bacterium]|nr:TonB-dependent receptor [Ignavibacteriaceae bacterium]
MKKIILFFLLGGSTLFAQSLKNSGQMNPNFSGKISGKTIDSRTNLPIEYANLVLFRVRDSVMVTGTITDPKGEFRLENVMQGKYYMKVSYIGYENKIIGDIMVNPQSPEKDLGVISLNPTAVMIGEVVVSSEKEMLTYNLDKKVINVERDLTSVGGTALDVMQNIPSVAVDADGGVSLRGNPNITFLVDGKPSGLAGISSSDVLTQIPASSIERIELVTNPSAKYDPEGTAGIINIVLKKKSNLGLNGFLSMNAGTRDKYNTSLNLNYKYEHFNLFINYDTRFNNFEVTSSSLRNSITGNNLSLLDQDQNLFNKNRMHNATGGIDYFIDDLNTISFSFQFRNMGMTNSGLLESKTFAPIDSLSKYYTRENSADRNVDSYNYFLSYRKTFGNKFQELTADAMYSDNAMSRTEDITQTNLLNNPNSLILPLSLQRNESRNTNKMALLQSDYIHPVGEKGRLETGIKGTYKNLTTKNDYFLFDYSLNDWFMSPSSKNYFNLKEQIYAAYGIFQQKFDWFNYQVGVRIEQVLTDARLEGSNEDFKNDYFSLYPTLHFGFVVSDLDEIRLSYSRRVDRPSNRQLNPFIDNTDSMNVLFGNPKLQPQYTNSFELGYNKTIDKTSLTTTVFYRRTDDLISTISNIDNNGVTNTTFANIAKGNYYGAELIAVHPLLKWWRLNANFSFYKTVIDDNGLSNISIDKNSWTAKINSQMTLWEEIQIQLSFNYNSPTIMSQQSFHMGSSILSAQAWLKEVYFLDAAIKKDFLDGRLSVTLRVSDVFNTRKFNSETMGQGFFIDSYRKMESRTAYLGFTFRLMPNGKQNESERRKPDTEGMDF